MKSLYDKYLEKYKTPSKQIFVPRESKLGSRSLERSSKVTALKKANCVTLRSKQDRAIWYVTEEGVNMRCSITVADAMFLQKITRHHTEYMKIYYVRKFIGGNAWAPNAEVRYRAILDFNCAEYLKPKYKDQF